MISPPPDSLSSRTESASAPSSNIELFRSTLVKVREAQHTDEQEDDADDGGGLLHVCAGGRAAVVRT